MKTGETKKTEIYEISRDKQYHQKIQLETENCII